MATTYYVAPPGSGGSDSNPGTIGSPFATINHACSVMVAGDTTLVRAGTYAEELNNAIPGGSSSNVQVTIAAYPGSAPYEVATIQPSGAIVGEGVISLSSSSRTFITIQGLVIDAVNAGASKDVVKITWGTSSGASSNITIKDCEIKNSASHQGVLITTDPVGGRNADNNQILNCKIHNNGNSNLHHGIYCSSSNNIIDGNECYSNAGYGIQIFDTTTHDANFDQNNIIRNNLVHDNNTAGSGSGGIVIATGDNNQVYNNVVWNNTGGTNGGIQIGFGANASKIWNNTCYNNSDYGIHIQSTATNTTAQNNILRSNVTGDLIDNGTGSTVDHNTTNNTDPKFVNAGTDFHLQSTSPAIDAGITIAQVTTDKDGVTRPQGTAYDQGAYEFVGGQSYAITSGGRIGQYGKSPMRVR